VRSGATGQLGGGGGAVGKLLDRDHDGDVDAKDLEGLTALAGKLFGKR
jgi:hypothetical protein